MCRSALETWKLFREMRSPLTPSKAHMERQVHFRYSLNLSLLQSPKLLPPPPFSLCLAPTPSLRAAPVPLLLLVRQMMATGSLVRALCGTRCRPRRPCEATSYPPGAARPACFLHCSTCLTHDSKTQTKFG